MFMVIWEQTNFYFYGYFGDTTSSMCMAILEPKPLLSFYAYVGAKTTSMFMVILEPKPRLFFMVILEPNRFILLLFWSQNHLFVYGY